ncbi:hypothetical protein KC19_8G009800 [Ceratodon purpureus]|uniref:Uncharacterized protein n=1 Tax=Ceratodon purpureus TaxID=3225 RepID=A0A8T0H246_CERPU|nr:hypothetical protein KC19_8G009800 [Ceratodon purpureus]
MPLGRQSAASFPTPITFPRSSSFSFDEIPNNYQDARSGQSQAKVVAVEAGGMMSSAIDNEGGLWLWGAVPEPSAGVQITDSDSYQKADAFELANIDKPERVLALRDQRVRRVACGNEHILALVEGRNGIECYAWGSNSYGQLGLGDFEARDIPTQMTALKVPQYGLIVDLACGAFHSTIVTMKAGEEDLETERETEYAAMAKKMDRPPVMMESPNLRGRAMPEQYIDSPRMRTRQLDQRGQGGYPGHNGRNPSSVVSDGSSRAYSQSSMSSWTGTGGRAAQGKSREAGFDTRLSTCWTFGQNENGQLGLGTFVNSHTPAAVEALPTRERIQTAICGLFHTAVVMESGDVWVWGMEGGLGQCPGIGPPGSKSGDAPTPVRVFGESSAKCNPMTGAKGIACGAAHTVTVSNGGKDLWAWGRGKNGVLGLGHHSDSWFPSPVLWPPGVQSSSKDSDADGMYDIHRKSGSPASSKGGSRGRGDEIRPYVREVEDARPPRNNSYGRLPVDQYVREVREVDDRPPRGYSSSLRKAMESPGRPRRGDLVIPQSPGQTVRRGEHAMESPGGASRGGDRGMQSPARPTRRGDQFWPPSQPEPENPKSFLRRETGTEPSSTSMGGFKYQVGGAMQSEDVTSLKAELAECRRYAENLHAAVYGGLEDFPGNSSAYYNDSRFDGRKTMQGFSNGSVAKASGLQEWQQHVEDASMEELTKLDLFYKDMRNRLKDILFQRKMEDWCLRALSGSSAASYQEPPPVREPYSVQSTPYFDGPGELALRMSGIMSDRGEMLPPAALAASLAEFRLHPQRRR